MANLHSLTLTLAERMVAADQDKQEVLLHDAPWQGITTWTDGGVAWEARLADGSMVHHTAGCAFRVGRHPRPTRRSFRAHYERTGEHGGRIRTAHPLAHHALALDKAAGLRLLVIGADPEVRAYYIIQARNTVKLAGMWRRAMHQRVAEGFPSLLTRIG